MQYNNQQQPPSQWPQPPFPGQQWQPPQYVQVDQRNYTPAAWLSAGLTVFLVIPGLIATGIYLVEAYGVKKRTGITPQGYGCLWAVLIWCLLPVVGLSAFLLLTILSSMSAFFLR